MFKSYALGLLTTLTLGVASISQAAVNPLIYGRWASVQKVEETTYTLALAIQEKQSSLSVTCAKAGKTTTARITVPAEVTDKQLLIKGTASDEKDLGDIS
jgi:hypothetical protein